MVWVCGGLVLLWLATVWLLRNVETELEIALLLLDGLDESE